MLGSKHGFESEASNEIGDADGLAGIERLIKTVLFVDSDEYQKRRRGGRSILAFLLLS